MTVTTRLWVCVECGDVMELPLDQAPEHRDEHRSVYCDRCWGAQVRARARARAGDELGPRSPRGGSA